MNLEDLKTAFFGPKCSRGYRHPDPKRPALCNGGGYHPTEPLRHAARCQSDDDCLLHADALKSGDPHIVNTHNALLCSDEDCRQNTQISCALLKNNIALLAALKKVAEAARPLTLFWTGQQPLRDALAELDALNGDTP